MKNIRYYIILALFIIALICSIILSFTSVSLICSVNNNCDTVYHSIYNSFLGVQNSYYGIAIFFFMTALIIFNFIKPTKNKKALINLSIIIGSIVALYLLYVQHFVLQAYCKYCLIIDFSMIICLILILPELKNGLAGLKIKNEENIAAGS